MRERVLNKSGAQVSEFTVPGLFCKFSPFCSDVHG